MNKKEDKKAVNEAYQKIRANLKEKNVNITSPGFSGGLQKNLFYG